MDSSSTTKQPSSKRLVFDRRYGWIVDEWKEASEAALSGARGMFCILPLAKSLVKLVSDSVNLAAHSAVKVFEKPDEFSSQALQTSLNNQLQKFMYSIKDHDFNLFKPKQNSPIISMSSTQHMHLESNSSQNT